jgi:hypothetical protein
MAHFAEIGLNNTVLRVIVVGNDDCKDQFGNESEVIGAKFCNNLFGGVWLQTSYNGNMRKNYAGIGFTYDSARDAFISPKPYASWVLDEATCQWVAPVARPVDDKQYIWDETTTSWVEYTPPQE